MPPTSSTRVVLDVGDDGVALITLDGPETLNAFSAATAAELGDAYRTCDQDDAVRAVVVTGAGRAFCSGADLRPGAGSFREPDEAFSASPVQPPAWEVGKLVLAAVNGHAIGIGLTLALQCDLRIVAAEARLAIPQVRHGMVGDAQSHWTLRRAAGAGLAADLLLTGRTITGDEAAARGLAVRALPGDQVLGAALELAREVAASARPEAVALSKRILWDDLSLDEVGRAETAAHRALMADPSFQERWK